MKPSVPLLSTLALGWLALAPAARAQTLSPSLVATFPASVNNVTGSLVQDGAGNLYGTAAGDGTTTHGAVFRVTPAGDFAPLYAFSGGADGDGPESALLVGADGNFYGTTVAGGSQGGFGTIFRLTPAGALTTLHSFNQADGRGPEGSLVVGPDGFLYGATLGGGTNNTGTFYKIALDGSGFASLHSFVQGEGTAPQSSPVAGGDGYFYGTTAYNGTPDNRGAGTGSVYRISPGGDLAVLHLFDDATEGSGPFSTLLRGADGAFYGVNPDGGANGGGTVYRVTPGGNFSVLYAFSATDDSGVNGDGSVPTGALVDGGNGSFYGVANMGGANGSGTVFSITPGGAFAPVYSFDATDANGVNGPGAFPFAGFLPTADGHLYVPLPFGGANATGTVLAFNLGSGAPTSPHLAFFAGEAALGNGVYYLAFPNGNPFGYYAYLTDPRYVYHFDLGYEYTFDAADGKAGVYLYDFAAGDFLYTSPTFPFPYLYNFTLNSVLYYYPDPSNPGRYDTNGVRYFYNFATGQIITR